MHVCKTGCGQGKGAGQPSTRPSMTHTAQRIQHRQSAAPTWMLDSSIARSSSAWARSNPESPVRGLHQAGRQAAAGGRTHGLEHGRNTSTAQTQSHCSHPRHDHPVPHHQLFSLQPGPRPCPDGSQSLNRRPLRRAAVREATAQQSHLPTLSCCHPPDIELLHRGAILLTGVDGGVVDVVVKVSQGAHCGQKGREKGKAKCT